MCIIVFYASFFFRAVGFGLLFRHHIVVFYASFFFVLWGSGSFFGIVVFIFRILATARTDFIFGVFLRYVALRCVALRFVALRCVTLRYVAFSTCFDMCSNVLRGFTYASYMKQFKGYRQSRDARTNSLQ